MTHTRFVFSRRKEVDVLTVYNSEITKSINQHSMIQSEQVVSKSVSALNRLTELFRFTQQINTEFLLFDSYYYYIAVYRFP